MKSPCNEIESAGCACATNGQRTSIQRPLLLVSYKKGTYPSRPLPIAIDERWYRRSVSPKNVPNEDVAVFSYRRQLLVIRAETDEGDKEEGRREGGTG